jgi:hypothetical protein
MPASSYRTMEILRRELETLPLRGNYVNVLDNGTIISDIYKDIVYLILSINAISKALRVKGKAL